MDLTYGTNFAAFYKYNLYQWYFYTFFGLEAFFSTLFAREKQEVPERTRMGYLLKLNLVYYISLLISVLFMPIIFTGDGRFYSFLIGVNALFLLFFVALMNPFYFSSTHFPQLETMTALKVLAFSLCELVAYLIMSGLHLVWGYILSDKNVYNKTYAAEGYKSAHASAAYFFAVSQLPSMLLMYNGLLQLVVRIWKICKKTHLYPNEDAYSYYADYREYKGMLRSYRRERTLLEQRSLYRARMNFRMD